MPTKPLHPQFQIAPAQHAAVDALRARLSAAIQGAPKPWMTKRALRLGAKLERHIDANDSLGLTLFLGDWQEGIESECRTLENAAKVLRDEECPADLRRAA